MFTYVTEPFLPDTESVPTHIGRVPAGIADPKALIAATGQALCFPEFFGKNLDAFWDLLRDFPSELPRRIYLIHTDLPLVDADYLGRYLQVLADGCRYWGEDGGHDFNVIFPYSARDEVARLVQTM